VLFHELNEVLFSEGNLRDALEDHVRKAAALIDDIESAQFRASTDNQIVEYVLAKLTIYPLELHAERQTLAQEEMPVDVSAYPTRNLFGRSGPIYVRGTRLTVCIPYTGQSELWKVAPSPFWVPNPFGNAHGRNLEGVGRLEIVIDHPSDEAAESVSSLLTTNLNEIDTCLKAQRAEIERRNAEIEPIARETIRQRREALKNNEGIAAALRMPLTHRDGIPEVVPLQLRRRLKRPLPSPLPTGVSPEPGLEDGDFEHILSVVRHVGRTFEATPATYRSLEEQDLRNIILANLNSHYDGGATGETFRHAGKTDIRIDFGSKAAFVAECKIWYGATELDSAVSQLLTYLTWRDAKAALVIFNKHNLRFSELLNKVPDVLRAHASFIDDLGTNERGEWRMIFSTEHDPGRRVTVQILMFDVMPPKSSFNPAA